MAKLAEVLPDLVLDMEGALLSLGRGDLVTKLKAATLVQWTYDDFSDTAYLTLNSSQPTGAIDADRFSLYDELGVNLDSNARGELCGIEILDGQRVTSLLPR